VNVQAPYAYGNRTVYRTHRTQNPPNNIANLLIFLVPSRVPTENRIKTENGHVANAEDQEEPPANGKVSPLNELHNERLTAPVHNELAHNELEHIDTIYES